MTSLSWSWQYFHQELEEALAASQHALDIAEKQGDVLEQAIILNQIAAIHREKHEDYRALPIYEHMLSLVQSVGNRNWEAIALLNIAQTCCRLSDWSRMQEVCQEALPILQEIGDKPAEASALLLLAQAHDSQAHDQEVVQLLRRALQIQIEADVPEVEDTRAWLEELQIETAWPEPTTRIDKPRFAALLSNALETAAASAEVCLTRSVSRNFEIELHGAGYSGVILTPEQAVDILFIEEETFYRIIDVAVVAVQDSNTRVFMRVSGHTPSDWKHTWSPSAEGPFKQLRTQNIRIQS